MDQITFHHDTVLSDVHMLLPNASHLMTRLNHVGQPVFISNFKILLNDERLDNNDTEQSVEQEKCDDPREDLEKDINATQEKVGEEGGEGNVELCLDDDGDLHITHRPRKYPVEGRGRDLVCPIILQQSKSLLEQEEENTDDKADQYFKDVIRIEHTMATPLEDVGKQVWRGAFLFADFILSKPVMFRGATVLELGAGTGLTSVVMATTAKTVYCTDVGEDLLSMCKRNVTLNRHMTEPAGGEVRVRQLDWLQHSLCTDADGEFSWTEEEVDDLYDNTSVIVAADVCYDDDLTDGFFRTLYRLCSSFTHACTIFISIEKRMNFTLRDMDVSCEAYNYFSHCLSQLQDLMGGRCCFRVEQLPSNFAQFFLYERIEQLPKNPLTFSLGATFMFTQTANTLHPSWVPESPVASIVMDLAAKLFTPETPKVFCGLKQSIVKVELWKVSTTPLPAQPVQSSPAKPDFEPFLDYPGFTWEQRNSTEHTDPAHS